MAFSSFTRSLLLAAKQTGEVNMTLENCDLGGRVATISRHFGEPWMGLVEQSGDLLAIPESGHVQGRVPRVTRHFGEPGVGLVE